MLLKIFLVNLIIKWDIMMQEVKCVDHITQNPS